MNTRRSKPWRNLALLLFSPLVVSAQTVVWIAPGPFLDAAYDPALGYVPFIYAPPGDWNDPASWDTGVVPNGTTAQANFSGHSNGLWSLPGRHYPGIANAVIPSGTISLSELHYTTGSGPTQIIPQLTIGTDTSSANLILTGPGITWTNGLPGNYLGGPAITVRNGLLEFDNQASAIGTITAVSPESRVVFRHQASAATATIYAGSLDFYDQSTAGQAGLTITSYGTTGLTFHDHATFGNATLSPYSSNSVVTFLDYSSAGSLQAVHPFATPPWPDSPRIAFLDHATAANALLDVSDLTFSGQSTAASATLKVTGGNVNESHGFHVAYTASLQFSDRSTAAQSVIVNSAQGTVTFRDDSSAGSAFITNNGTLLFSGRTAFADAHLDCGSGQMVSGNTGHVDPYGELYFIPQYVTTGRVTFKDQAAGGSGSITLTNANVILDFSGLYTPASGADGRALLPATPAGDAITPNDAGSISFGSISDATTGGTIILGGTRLQLGSANHDMTLNARIADVGGAYGTLAGQPLKGGGLDKVGSGTLTIANPANDYSGNTAIQQGTLNLANGRISSTTIAPGAWLTGTGTVAGILANSGVLSPGNSPGTITVQGDFVQNSTGVLAIEILSPASFDRLAVTGTAQLGGTLALSAPPGFTPVGSAKINLLTAGAVTGRFDIIVPAQNLTRALGAAMPWQILYSSTGAGFQMTQLPFAGFGGASPAASALGAQLDATLAASTGAYRQLIAGLNALSTSAQIGTALTALAPDRYSILAENSFAAAASQRAALDRRLAAWRTTPAGRFELFFEAGSRTTRFSAAADLPEARSRLNRGTAGGVWHHGGFDFGTAFTDETGHADLDALGSSAKIRSLVPALFAQYASEPLFLSVCAVYSSDDYRLRRRIVYPGYDQTATADASGSRLDFSADAGWRFSAHDWTLTPSVGLTGSRFTLDDFAETGAAGANLAVTHWSNRSLRSRAGLEASRSFAKVTPSVRITWLHEFAKGRSFAAGFAEGNGSPYNAPGRPADTDILQAALSLDAQLGRTATGYISLGGAWGKNSRTTTDLCAGVRWQF